MGTDLQTEPGTLERLAELERAATPGPWHHPYADSGWAARIAIETAGTGESSWFVVDTPENAAFLTALRNAAPDLLGAARREAGLRTAAQEVWDSIPASFDDDDPMVQRHSRALNDLGRLLESHRRAALESSR